MKFLNTWAKHLPPSEQEAFKKYVLNSGPLLDRLDSMLADRVLELRRLEQSEDYTSPSWPYLQADRLGQLKSIVKIRQLLQRESN